MSAGMDLSNALDRLPDAEDKLNALQNIQTLLSSVPVSSLGDVAPNVNFSSVFECLNTNSQEQIEACCDVLNHLLSALEATVLPEQFQQDLLLGLQHPAQPVVTLCLKQLTRAAGGDAQMLASQTDILLRVAECVEHESLDVAQEAMEILTVVGSDRTGVQELLQGPVFQQIQHTSQQGDVHRFRVYQLIVNISCASRETLLAFSQNGLLQQLVNEVYKDDVLVQLNCLEMLSVLARSPHGLGYLQQAGVINKMSSLLSEVDNDPLLGFLQPGLLKFFGHLGAIHPAEVLQQYPVFVERLLAAVQDNDIPLQTIAVETFSFIGQTTQGKQALNSLGPQMLMACKYMGNLMASTQGELKIRVLNALADLIRVKDPVKQVNLQEITENWFNTLHPRPLEVIMGITGQPFTEMRVAALGVINRMACQTWGQRMLNNHAGFNEYLLDRSTEKAKEGKEAKYEVVQTLVESSTASDLYDAAYFLKLRQYVREGPFYVKTEAAVALEGAS